MPQTCPEYLSALDFKFGMNITPDAVDATWWMPSFASTGSSSSGRDAMLPSGSVVASDPVHDSCTGSLDNMIRMHFRPGWNPSR